MMDADLLVEELRREHERASTLSAEFTWIWGGAAGSYAIVLFRWLGGELLGRCFDAPAWARDLDAKDASELANQLYFAELTTPSEPSTRRPPQSVLDAVPAELRPVSWRQ